MRVENRVARLEGAVGVEVKTSYVPLELSEEEAAETLRLLAENAPDVLTSILAGEDPARREAESESGGERCL